MISYGLVDACTNRRNPICIQCDQDGSNAQTCPNPDYSLCPVFIMPNKAQINNTLSTIQMSDSLLLTH